MKAKTVQMYYFYKKFLMIHTLKPFNQMHCSFCKISEKYGEIFQPLPDLWNLHLVKKPI